MAPYATGSNSPHSIEDGLRAAASYDVTQITVVASSRAVVNDRVTPATLIISNTTGKILAVFEYILNRSHFPETTSYTDYSPRVLLPGLVDAHVHLNEPGRTEWEGFWTGTRAAAFGGVTTVVDMPLNAIPPTTTVAGMKEKVAAAQGKCWVDVAFYGGIVPGNVAELKPLIREGVRGFKGFLIDSGVEEFPAVSPDDIRAVFAELADEPTTVMFHAEMLPCNSNPEEAVPQRVDSMVGFLPSSNDLYQTFLDSRPSSFETYAIEQILSLAPLAPNLPLHIVHLSAVEAIPLLRAARRAGVNITAETCPHYLSLAAEGIRAGDTRAKCCPPIRNQANQDGLWDELLAESQAEGREDSSVIQTVVSDHSPCTPNLKLLPASIPSGAHSQRHVHDHKHDHTDCAGKQEEAAAVSKEEGDFMAAWGGISSVGLGLPIMWTEAVHHRKQSPTSTLLNLVRWCCVNTAKQVGLEHRKGSLSVGMDADIAVFDPEAAFEVRPDTMLFRNKCSPYEGRVLRGVVAETWVRGRKVHSRDSGFEKDLPSGELLLEPRKKMVVA